jgi:hypothetical protein
MDRFLVYSVDPKPTPDLLETFEDLPNDEYLQGGWAFRKRAYARGLVTPGGIEWVSGSDFFQPSSINAFAGDIRRVFAPAGTKIREYVWQTFQDSSYREGLGDDTYELGLHQIRIVCDDEHEGHPVPEGFHQDGFDVVVIQSYQRRNITGGKSFLREGSIEGPCVLEHDLLPGEMLVFNDRRMFHYADPIRPQSPGPGCRDLCVMTLSLVR